MEIGTLKGLNAKPGDQLVFVEQGENEIGYHYQKGYLVEVEEDGTVYGCSPKYCDATWRVVSRASYGPVRTVTTTRREVVPGVYGHIWIDRVDGDIAVIGMRNNALKKMDTVGMSAGELRAAAETLIQIADAL